MSRNSNIIVLVKMPAVITEITNFAMTILAISENQGSKLQFLTIIHFCGPKFQNNVFEKKQQIVLTSDFSVSIICSNTNSS